MKTYWGGGGYVPLLFLSSLLDGGERIASRPGRFTPGETVSALRYEAKDVYMDNTGVIWILTVTVYRPLASCSVCE
jgi:hypothetical protein